MEFYQLQINKIQQETSDTVSLSFEIPTEKQSVFQFFPGQYLTLKFDLNGKEERRAYSMSSSPLDKDLTVTVKRVDKGLVSNHIQDKLKVGDTVEVLAPQGRFLAKINEENRKTYYLFGAGSGITPLMSILRTVLEGEPQSSVFLFYGNRKEEDIIFRKELDLLQQRYKGQLIVEYLLSQPKQEKSGGISGIFGKKKTLWIGRTGRLDKAQASVLLDKHTPRYSDTEYFMCGPGGMNEGVEALLLEKGIDKSRINREVFTTSDADKKDVNAAAGAIAKIKIDNKVHELVIPEGKTILDALLDEKIEAPYSCTSGSCSTCIAKVTKGSSEMEVCYALDDDEVEEGFVLTCQAKPTSAEIELDFDV